MKNSNLVFRVDIPDFKSKKEIIDVLDKILKNGIGCLSESDKFILK